MQPWIRVGESALRRDFAGQLDAANAAARAELDAVRRAHVSGLADVVLGARAVLAVLEPDANPDEVVAALSRLEASVPDTSPTRAHEIAVSYDGDDLDDVAARAGLGRDDVVRLHAGATYTVAFLGFAPGFAYLLGLPPALHVPRLDTPRARVPAGAVAIAGPWAGVYPDPTPGGWRLLGRTDAVVFDSTRGDPCLFAPGDTVRFVPA